MCSVQEFKQRVIVALLQDLKWMPAFGDTTSAAAYIGEPAPTTERDTVILSQKLLAVLVVETAERIIEASC